MAKEKFIQVNTHDQKVLEEIQGLLGVELEQATYVRYGVNRYVVEKTGAVVGLGLYDCGIDTEKFQPLTGLLTSLVNLTELYLRSNKLTDLSFLSGLVNLTELNLGDNNLTDVSFLSGLVNLTRLDLAANKLTDLSFLSGLVNLTELDLACNKLTDVSVLKGLTNLVCLGLYDNKIRSVPSWVTQLDMEIYCDSDGHGEGIDLENNPLETPPVEIVKQGREAIERYFRQLRKSEAETQKNHYLFEAKLLIIGEAGAGKTTFARKLKDPYAEMPKPKDTTRGIDVQTWSFDITQNDFSKLETLNIDSTKFYLNLWDFGGQAIYHGTHQFFFSKDALYAILADTREQKADFNYWLLTTEQLAGNSPLIIVLNKREGHKWRIDETGLKGRYGKIIKDIKTVDLSQPQEIQELQKSVKYWLSSLPMIGDKLPGSWVEIREELSKEKKEFIDYGKFQGICKKFGMTDIEDVRILSRYYDKIGVITHFIDDPVLQERVYIDSNWLVKTIYHLLDDETVKKQDGRLTKSQIKGIWKDNEIYQEVEKLVQLMLRFGLLFKVKDKDCYIVPEHLKDEKPYKQWPYEDGEVLEFHYELGKYMPKGLMTQLIVELHHHIKEYELVWWRGVNVEYNGAKAEVVETYGQDNKFVIRVSGKNRRDLLVIIREHLERIIGKYKKLELKKLVPCNCADCMKSDDPKFHFWDELQNLANKNISEITCGKSGKNADINKLLGEYGKVKKEEQDKIEMGHQGGGKHYNRCTIIEGDVMSNEDRSIHARDISHAAVATGNKNVQEVKHVEGSGEVLAHLAELRAAVEGLGLEAKEMRQVVHELDGIEGEAKEVQPDHGYIAERVEWVVDKIDKAGKLAQNVAAIKGAALGIATWCGVNGNELVAFLNGLGG